MTLQPTPFRAALAGLFSALSWPLLWARFGGGPASAGQVELIVATLLLVALPAHLFVLGLGPGASPGGRLDRALLLRIGAWLAAAALGMLLAPLIHEAAPAAA
ncbi:hypothetical protein JI742_12240 [Piscinibacter sp. Jin2]|uniref:Uncharacterized protein n=1 Tax=Aquariibacter lacus TaxID=2801332 RepID=A0A9X0XFA1_9BURK|nr:hypothetical protein [Piscinibacter lacus]MBL0720654.1 hypothetical protein [Piscinibacter lacus]